MKWLALVLLIVGCSKKVIKEDILTVGVVKKSFTTEKKLPVKENPPKKETHYLNLDDVLFDFDKKVLNRASFPVLGRLASELNTNPSATIILEGYACEIGTNSYNLALSDARAIAVKRYLMDYGIEEYRIKSVAYGEEYPLGGELYKDRRVELEWGIR